jgi:hypothetical protein
LARHFEDLGVVVELGERWGFVIAQHDERRQLLYRAKRSGPSFLEAEARELGYSPEDIFDLYEWLDLGIYRGTRRWLTSAYPTDIIQSLAAARATRSLGSQIEVLRAEYRNPIEIVLGGSGFLLLGAAYSLRLVRDWANTRRVGAAQATQAEHEARRAGCHADLSEWLVSEARNGRLYVPPHELVNLVTKTDFRAIDRLADNDIHLELPAGTDALQGEDEEAPDSGGH